MRGGHRGWGNLGEGAELPESVYLLDAVPHDWLFPLCSAVVHHGGAGTVAAGLLPPHPRLPSTPQDAQTNFKRPFRDDD